MRAHRPVLQPHGRVAGRQVARPAARARTAPWCWPSPTCGSPRACTTRSTCSGAPSASISGRLRPRRRGRVAKTPEWQEAETGVPAGTCARSRASGGQRGRISPPAASSASAAPAARHRHRLGARHGLPHGHAGAGQARRQHGLPAAGHAARHPLLLPRLRRGRHVGRPDRHRAEHQHVPAHAAARDGQHRLQVVPRLKIPEAILDGHCEAYPTDAKSIEGQFQRYEYPAPGHSEVKMYYKYGGSHFGTMTDTNRFARMYRSDKLEFVVNQSHLDRGRGQVRRRHPPGLHQLRALGHQRGRQLRRLHPARVHAEQPPRRGDAAQVHRAAGRVASPTTRSSWTSRSGWAWAPCTPRASPRSTGASGCSTRPTCRSAVSGSSSSRRATT